MKKVLTISMLAMALGCLAGYGQRFNWGTAGQILVNQDEELLTGDQNDPSAVGFVQLLHLGPGGTYDYTEGTLAGIGGDGTLGDDLVIAKSWIGDGAAFSAFADGFFDAGDRPLTDIYKSGVDSFAIRVFDTPSPDWEKGLIPTTGHYNYYEFFEPLMGVDERYDLVISNGSFDEQRLVINSIIPEPSSLLLLGIAAMALVYRRRIG